MDNQPLLSVIVSCYNLEQYVDKCVSSIVAQTYSNLEILLINDGSTDTTGMRCDVWQEKDGRISVIHKQNEGLSYTRKTGVEHATAEYVTFVDVDDWIDKNMYNDMMSALLTTNSDIAQCGYCKVFEDGRREHCHQENQSDSLEVVGRNEGVLLLLEDKKWQSFLWNKIFKKCLFDHVSFQKNLNLGEDFISHDLFHHASQSVYLHNDYYFYFQRGDSMLNIKNIKGEMKKLSDFSDAYYERYLFTSQHPEYHSALSRVKFFTISIGICLLRNASIYPKHITTEYFCTKVKRIRSISITHQDKLPRSIKFDWYIINISSTLFKFLRLLYICIIRTTNRLKITNRKTSPTLSDLGWLWHW